MTTCIICGSECDSIKCQERCLNCGAINKDCSD